MREYSIKFVENSKEWDDFVDSSPQGTVFSKWEPMNAFAGVHDSQSRFLAVMDGVRIAAGVSYVEIARGPFKKAVTSVIAPYGGLMHSSSHALRGSEGSETEGAELLIKKLMGSYDHILLVHSPGLKDIRPFIWAGWKERVRYTYLLELDDAEIIHKNMEHRTRKQIKHAELTHVAGDSISMEAFRKINDSIYRRKGQSSPVDNSKVIPAVYSIIENGFGEIISIKRKDGTEPEAAIAYLRDNSTVYSWFGGADPQGNSAGLTSLLTWEAIKKYSGKRLKFDLVGANIPSIAFFKQGFGGILTPYYSTEYYRSEAVRLAMKAYTGVKRFLP